MNSWDWIVLLFIFRIQQHVFSYPSDSCYSRSGHRGVCKPLKECPSAHEDFYHNIFPTPCGFFGWHRNPIICCRPSRRVKSRIVKLEPAPVYEEPESDFYGYHPSHKEHAPYGEKIPSYRNKSLRGSKPYHRKPPAPVHEDGGDEFNGGNYNFDIKKVENWNKLSGRRKFPTEDEDSENRKTLTPAHKDLTDELHEGNYYFDIKKIENWNQLSGRRKFPTDDEYSDKNQTLTPNKTFSENQTPGKMAQQKCSEILQMVCPNVLATNSTTAVYNQLLVQGEKTREHEFPHMAAVGYGDANSIVWLCGGSLISEKFVMTAAHCLVSQRLGPAQWVHLGAERLQDSLRGGNPESMPGQTHPVVRRIRHPDYRPPSKYNDIALLELGPALGDASLPTMSTSIYPACLHVDEDQPVSKAIATGWGRVGLGEDLSPDLLKVELSVIDKSTCNDSYEVEISTTSWLDKGIDSSLICAGEPGEVKDTCLGDSGGPLQYITADSCVHKILAVTSFGKVCGLGNAPGAYTHVPYFISWIEKVVWPIK